MSGDADGCVTTESRRIQQDLTQTVLRLHLEMANQFRYRERESLELTFWLSAVTLHRWLCGAVNSQTSRTASPPKPLIKPLDPLTASPTATLLIPSAAEVLGENRYGDEELAIKILRVEISKGLSVMAGCPEDCERESRNTRLFDVDKRNRSR